MKRLKALLIDHLGCTSIESITSLNTSSLNQTYHAKTNQGTYFIKTQPTPIPHMYEGEAKSLQALAETATFIIPTPVYYDDQTLILEYLEILPHTPESQIKLGEQLAKLHLTRIPWDFGFNTHNTLGTTLQINTWNKDWISFFTNHRLTFQLSLLPQKDDEIHQLLSNLLPRIPTYFQDITVRPSLLHGDLWSGNTGATSSQDPILYDPASYYGHHEAELSIMHMFGGFFPACFEAYHAHIPKSPLFHQRQLLYQLYHYLNHYHLFGPTYRPPILHILHSLQG